MAKPAGKCVFCGGPRLTKGHIWPDFLRKILPVTATHHEEYSGHFFTFEPTVPTAPKSKKIRQGHARSRKPRNTCAVCNSGWMSTIESSSAPILTALVQNKSILLDTAYQRKLAALLCLISMRLECISGATSIPQSDKDWLRNQLQPSFPWKIWVAKYVGSNAEEHWSRFCPMQIMSAPTTEIGADYCNMQVTTLVMGSLCAHIFSSTIWPNFQGYEGVHLTQIWPPTHRYINSGLMPSVDDKVVLWLHEAIARESKAAPEHWNSATRHQ